MSQFLNKGYRKDKIKQEVREQVEHLNSFHRILDRLEDLYQELIEEGKPEVTLDNIQQLASEITGRELDNTELFVLKGKLGLKVKRKEDEQEDNTK